MYIQELYALTIWVHKEIVSQQIVQKYQQLAGKLNQNAQPNRQKQPFEAEQKALFIALKNINLITLNEEQKNFLEKLNILNLIDENANNLLQDILYKNSLDIVTAAQKINEKYTILNQGIVKIQKIRESLSGLVDDNEEIIDKAIIRVHFDKDASIKNVVDFKQWSAIWYDISRGITMFHETSPEDVHIIGANKGSIIIELATAYAITKTFSEIILKVLQVIEKVYDIRKKAEEIRVLGSEYQNIATDLEKKATNIKKLDIEMIVKEIIDNKTDTDGEVENNLKKSITKLLDFVDKGGEIDFTLHDYAEGENGDEATNEIKSLLKNKFQEIRLLENKLKQIEYKENNK